MPIYIRLYIPILLRPVAVVVGRQAVSGKERVDRGSRRFGLHRRVEGTGNRELRCFRKHAFPFAEERHGEEHDAVAEPIPDGVKETGLGAVLHGEGFGPAHDDAVGDNQADEDGKFEADGVDVGLEDLVGDDDKRGDDRQLGDDPNTRRDVVAPQADGDVRSRSARR